MIAGINELLDFQLRGLADLARKGDALAATRLHEELSDALCEGRLGPYGTNLLIWMHCSLAEHGDPAAAMLMAKPDSRPVETRSHREIFMAVHKRICEKERPTNAYSQVAKELGKSPKTVKNIYLEQRKRLRDD